MIGLILGGAAIGVIEAKDEFDRRIKTCQTFAAGEDLTRVKMPTMFGIRRNPFFYSDETGDDTDLEAEIADCKTYHVDVERDKVILSVIRTLRSGGSVPGGLVKEALAAKYPE